MVTWALIMSVTHLATGAFAASISSLGNLKILEIRPPPTATMPIMARKQTNMIPT